MVEAEAALDHTDWLDADDGVLSILNYAHDRTLMPGASNFAPNF